MNAGRDAQPAMAGASATGYSVAEVVRKAESILTKRIPLPAPVAKIYEAVAELEKLYDGKGRRFTPDGHLVGSIGEVVIAHELGLELYPNSYRDHDAHGPMGDVQIKLVGLSGNRIALYGDCNYLIVAKMVSVDEAEIVYCGPGEPVCAKAGRPQRDGQRAVSLRVLRELAENSN
jgi:hypothetical protein